MKFYFFLPDQFYKIPFRFYRRSKIALYTNFRMFNAFMTDLLQGKVHFRACPASYSGRFRGLYKRSTLGCSIIALLFYSSLNLNAQVELSLEETISLARQNSFEAFQSKNLFLVKALNYQDFKRYLYPKAELSITPANYDRSIAELWDSESERYQPYEVQYLNSSANLSLRQYIGPTGGTVSLSSGLRRTKTFKENQDDYLNYISNPITLSYQQNFAGVNDYKWRARIDPVMFEEAKKQYLEDVENVTIKAISLFFDLLNAEMRYQIASLNKNNADTLYSFGSKKLNIGAVSRDEYLNLELKKINAGIALESASLAREEAQLELNNFLEMPGETAINCVIPENIPFLSISIDKALDRVFSNNPDIIALERKLMEAQQNLEQAKSQRFRANFNASIGFNQNREDFHEAYTDLRDRQTVAFTMTIPVINWSENRRSIARAKLNQGLITESARKQKDEIEMDVIKMVNEFNIKRRQAVASAQADSISQIAYEAVQQQFILGKANVVDINYSYTEMQNAQNNYLASLRNYWLQLYSLRKLSLYDFVNDLDLETDFDAMLDNAY